jgi:pyruvate/2-oxoglutarate/acetoin dehydrogenase E1 component
MKYFDELKKSMEWLAEKPETIFLGQAVEYPGTAMTNTLTNVPKVKLLEMPVAEEMQLGITIGMAVNGSIPISIYPRWNFLLLATNQLVNHLDKMAIYSNGEFNPKVIIRTSIGSERPINPQIQHTGDYSDAFKLMLKNIEVIVLNEPEEIFPAFQKAYLREDGRSTLLVEYGDYYNEK